MGISDVGLLVDFGIIMWDGKALSVFSYVRESAVAVSKIRVRSCAALAVTPGGILGFVPGWTGAIQGVGEIFRSVGVP